MAGPSTALRSAQDDILIGARRGSEDCCKDSEGKEKSVQDGEAV